MANRSSTKPGWAFWESEARCCVLRLRPPFNIRVDEPDRGIFYFVLHGSAWLDCDPPREGARELQRGTAVGLSAPHHLRSGSAFGKARELEIADTVPFLDPPEDGAVDIYMSSAPARTGAEPGRSVIVVPRDAQPTADNLAHLVALARNEMGAAAADSRMSMRRIGEMIMVQLLRYTRGRARGGFDLSEDGDAHDQRLMRALLAFMESPASPWTVESLAQVAGMSRPAFSARFHALMGQPPLTCLNRLRLQEAAAKLETGGTPLVDVAASVGYRSEYGFVRAFRREFGLTPHAWRTEVAAGRIRRLATLSN